MRQITLTAIIAQDAETKIGKTNGQPYLVLNLVNHEYSAQSTTEDKTDTFWIRATSFQGKHLQMAKHFTKGKHIIVTGNYSDNVYTNKAGQPVIGRDIIVSDIYFNNSGGGQQQNNAAGTAQNGAAAQAPVTGVPQQTAAPQQAPMAMPTVDTNMGEGADDLPF